MNKEFSLGEISEYLYIVYDLWNENIYILTELCYGFANCLFVQYKSRFPIEFLLGTIIGSFCELANMEIDFIVKLNVLIIKLNRNLFFDYAFKNFLKKKSDCCMKSLINFYVSQLENYESAMKKGEIFSNLFCPPLKIRNFKVLLKEIIDLSKNENTKANDTLILDSFIFSFFLPLINCLNFNKNEKKTFFETWDQRGFFKYILYKKDYMHFFKLEMMKNVPESDYLDLFFENEIKDDDNLNHLFCFYE